MYQHLFQEGRIGSLTLANRVVMTAMGNHLANPDGTVSKDLVAFYVTRAEGGVGLIITECATVDFGHGRSRARQLAVSDDKYIPGLRKLADRVHEKGGRIAVQLYHPGRQGSAELNGVPLPAPSPIESGVIRRPVREISAAEIAQMVERFAAAAARVREAGIDAVELQGAHGHLINQFLSPLANRRTDDYGGSLENRLRFLREIVRAVRARCGADFPLLVRLSADEYLPGGITPEDTAYYARELEALGVDALDISAGVYESMNTAWEPAGYEQGWKSYLAEGVKKAVSIPVIGVCVIRHPAFADALIAEGKLDFAGSARQHYADPEWTAKARWGRDREIRRCISCLYCRKSFAESDRTGVEMGCAVNAQTGREREYGQIPMDGDARPAAVIGGGPAGMEAARVLALRGFFPVVFEAGERVGGQLLLAERPPSKAKIAWLTDYLTGQLEQMKVEVRLGQAPTAEALREIDPHAVVIAQGSRPVVPDSIPGVDRQNVYTAWQVLAGEVVLRDKSVAVVGSGMTGIETAHLLAAAGNRVQLFEMADVIGPGLYFQNRMDVLERIDSLGVACYPRHKLLAIEEGAARFETGGGVTSLPCDAVVLSLGARANTDGVEAVKAAFPQVSVVGDASQAGTISKAIREAFVAAYTLQ